jgi:hypothetical protein
MRLPFRRFTGGLVAVAFAGILLGGAPAAAEEAVSLPRLRILDLRFQRVLSAALDRSPTLRALVDALDASDVIVHVTAFEAHAHRRHGGELQLAGAAEGTRYLRIGLSRHLSDRQLAAMLAHEMQHAIEVASRPYVRDQPSFEALYEEIGFRLRGGTFETRDALSVAAQVGRELAACPHAQAERPPRR